MVDFTVFSRVLPVSTSTASSSSFKTIHGQHITEGGVKAPWISSSRREERREGEEGKEVEKRR
jgi:hypothetical protein